MTTPPGATPLTAPHVPLLIPQVAVVLDRHDDAIHTHAALAAHHPASGRITLHPGPGTTGDRALAHDLLAALGKPPLLPGYPTGRQPAWEAAIAWATALPITRLTVLRAHRLTARRIERLLHLRALTGIHLTLVCHRPRLTAALRQALHTTDHTVTADFEAAHRHYYGPAGPLPADDPTPPPTRWITLPALDRLVSYDSPTPCPAPCTPPPIAYRHRPPPAPLAPRTAREAARRLAGATAHPRLAATLAAALFTGASFQQLATARPHDYNAAAATLALHDRARFTDGCATHHVPPWARVFLTAAASFAQATADPNQRLLAGPHDRTRALHAAETARLRPPQPPPGRRASRVQWDWRERREAQDYDAMLTLHPAP